MSAALPAELLRRVDLDLLYPPFLRAILRALDACERRGARYVATRGTATWEEQAVLRARHLAGGPQAAAPGYSQHNFGIGIDFAADGDLDAPGLQPRWDAPAYAPLGEEVLRFGRLVWGGSFGDAPHVGLRGFASGVELAPLRRLYLATPGDVRAKLAACWRHLDARLPALGAR